MSCVNSFYSWGSSNCGMCNDPMPGERAELACGDSFHINCVKRYFDNLTSEQPRRCPSCSFQVTRFTHFYPPQVKLLRDLGKERLSLVLNPEYVAPPPENEYKGTMLKIFIEYVYVYSFLSPEHRKKDDCPIEIDSTSTFQELEDAVKKRGEFSSHYRASFKFNKKRLHSQDKLLEDIGFTSGSTLVVKLVDPGQD